MRKRQWLTFSFSDLHRAMLKKLQNLFKSKPRADKEPEPDYYPEYPKNVSGQRLLQRVLAELIAESRPQNMRYAASTTITSSDRTLVAERSFKILRRASDPESELAKACRTGTIAEEPSAQSYSNITASSSSSYAVTVGM